MKTLLHRTKIGWEHIVPGIVRFALNTLSSIPRRGAGERPSGTEPLKPRLFLLLRLHFIPHTFTAFNCSEKHKLASIVGILYLDTKGTSGLHAIELMPACECAYAE